MTMLRFSGLLPWWLVLIVGMIGSLWIARWVWRESRHVSNPIRWLLPTLRATAFFLILFMLARPTLYHQRIEGQLSKIRVLLDTSASMATLDNASTDETGLPDNAVEDNASKKKIAVGKANGQSRISQAVRWLIGDEKQLGSKEGWLKAMSQHHRVELLASSTEESGLLVWDSQSNVPLPKEVSVDQRHQNSAIGEFLLNALPKHSASSRPNQSDVATPLQENGDGVAAVILISDGQSNSGISIADAAQRYAIEKIPIFAIGMGKNTEPEDLGIISVEHSLRVNRSDSVRGNILIKERMPIGTEYRVSISHLDKLAFSKTLKSLDSGTRRIEFDIPAEQLVDQAKGKMPSGSEVSTVPIDLQFLLECGVPEISLENNSFASSLWGVDRKNTILILDRRGGWETRYVKNAMERDSAWDSTVAIGRSNAAQEHFPKSRVELFEYDLILTTLDTAREFNEQQQSWISDFVSLSGGGLIVLDSKRDRDSSSNELPLSKLLPITVVAQSIENSIYSVKLTQSAMNQAAFQLGANESSNESIWSQLPAPKSVRTVGLSPGAETMIELVDSKTSKTSQPLVATKVFGQGRVIYFAADETWRWRTYVADLYHQRFWNQIATWCMRAPFAVSDAFASLDSGLRVYSTTSTISVRAKLKQENLQPLENASVQAVVERDGERYLSIPLTPESEARGFYRSTLGPLPEGNYRVRMEAVGVPIEALNLSTQFIVQRPVDLEMQSLACNSEVLQQAATLTGGEFSFLDSASSITEKLKRFRSGKIVETQWILWQSFPWFVTIIGLLAAEWYLRKRAGLI